MKTLAWLKHIAAVGMAVMALAVSLAPCATAAATTGTTIQPSPTVDLVNGGSKDGNETHG